MNLEIFILLNNLFILIRVASSYNNLGGIYDNKEEYDKVIEYYEKSLKILQDKLGSDHIDIAASYNNLGLEKSLKIYLNKLEPDDIAVTVSYNCLGFVYENKAKTILRLNNQRGIHIVPFWALIQYHEYVCHIIETMYFISHKLLVQDLLKSFVEY
ncbi:hypothetical protein RFI_34611 [Reticulomyxa filosa]|uniref:Uncharacterized protein n=1 Tax=Reticulomyxa filosa TaxID=46433 RepID=X6LNT1_RETFI|nr:hypothetical protein RFI_34611 [Reticulomyxa filosa]|eukprot:ETO02802.1 hypothetical protein RFI_34611 [Reticulomyxa filosa]